MKVAGVIVLNYFFSLFCNSDHTDTTTRQETEQ